MHFLKNSDHFTFCQYNFVEVRTVDVFCRNSLSITINQRLSMFLVYFDLPNVLLSQFTVTGNCLELYDGAF